MVKLHRRCSNPLQYTDVSETGRQLADLSPFMSTAVMSALIQSLCTLPCKSNAWYITVSAGGIVVEFGCNIVIAMRLVCV